MPFVVGFQFSHHVRTSKMFHLRSKFRSTAAHIVAPVLRMTGYRFSKRHRMESTWVYWMVDVVKANLLADGF